MSRCRVAFRFNVCGCDCGGCCVYRKSDFNFCGGQGRLSERRSGNSAVVGFHGDTPLGE